MRSLVKIFSYPHIYIFVYFITIGASSTLDIPDTPDETASTSWYELVHRRTYILKRIKRSILWLKKLQKTKLAQTSIRKLSADEIEPLLATETIKETFANIKKTESLDDLFATWHHLSIYRHIAHIDPINDFLLILLILLKSIVLDPTVKNTSAIHTIPTPALLNMIDESLDQLVPIQGSPLGYTPTHKQITNFSYYKNLVPPSGTIHSMTTLLPAVSFTELLTRSVYYHKRLDTLFSYLTPFRSCFQCSWDFKDIIIDDHTHQTIFRHHIIRECIALLLTGKTLFPLFHIWQQISEGRFIDDEQLLKEFALLTYMVTNTVLKEERYRYNKAHIPITLVETYHQINSLPLNELLDVIDLLSDEFPKIAHACMEAKQKTWGEWATQYFFSLPISLIKLTLKVALLLKNTEKERPEDHENTKISPHEEFIFNDGKNSEG